MRRGSHPLLGAMILLLACMFTLCAMKVLWTPEYEIIPVQLKPCAIAGLLLGAAHILLRPILRLLAAPIGCLMPLAGGMVIDITLIYLCARYTPGFQVPDIGYAICSALTINVIAFAAIDRK